MLVVRLILAGDANSSLKMAGVLVRSCWTISQHHPTKHEGGEEAAFSFKRDGCFGSSTVSFLPRIYGFMKGDSTAKTCDPSTVKRVSGQTVPAGLS